VRDNNSLISARMTLCITSCVALSPVITLLKIAMDIVAIIYVMVHIGKLLPSLPRMVFGIDRHHVASNIDIY